MPLRAQFEMQRTAAKSHRLSALALGLLVAAPAGDAANCDTAMPSDGTLYFSASGWKSLGSADADALQALFGLSTAVSVESGGLQELAGATLCCAQHASDSSEWSVAAVTEDVDVCTRYGLTAPCILKHNEDRAYPLFHQDDNWHISCTNPGAGDGYVEKLELPDANLAGQLPEEVGTFDRLDKLDLRGNRLTGVHSDISNLNALTWANFDNAFTGGGFAMHTLLNLMMAITAGGADSTLEELRASGNRLPGSLPANFGSSMGALRVLELESNMMTGTLPSSLSQMLALAEMRLTDNRITGTIPGDISTLENLQDLELDDNDLEGEMPEFVADVSACTTDAQSATCTGLKSLRTLKLGENSRLSGTIPASIEFAESLHVLHLGSDGSTNQRLSGTIPAGVSALPLKEIDLSRHPGLTGTFPTNMLAAVDQLFTKAVFSNCGITGHLDELLTSIPAGYVRRHVQVLELQGNALSGTIPAIIGEFASLTALRFENNMLSGEIPREIGSLHRVGELNLANNNFAGNVPDLCSTPNDDPDQADCMTNLNSIELEDNKFSGFFRGIHTLSNLHTVNAVDNNFVAIASLPTSLQGLRLDDNNFYEDISRLTFTAEMGALRYISISNNRFLGDLAAAVAPLPNLQTLDASRNEFTGDFPAFSSSSLRDINLHTNLIDGVIPASFICDADRTEGRLTIKAYNNRLTGSWPMCVETPAWFQLPAEVKLVLHSNRFIGSFFNAADPILPRVLELDLSENAISSAALDWIPSLTSVKELLISSANIAGDISPFFAAIPDDSLQILDLSNNGLSGTLDGLGSAIHLQDLILSNNSLTGTLDTLGVIFTSDSRAVSDAGTITIRLNDNQFTGSVNFLVDNAATAHIDDLDLSNNLLSAQLPADMSSLPIRYFLISGNKFSGRIPILPPACHDPFAAGNNQGAATCLVDVDLGAQSGDGWDCPAPSSPPGLSARPWVNYVYHTASCACRLGKFSDSSTIDCVNDPAWNSGYGGCTDYVSTASETLHGSCTAHGADLACPVACDTCTDATTPSYRFANDLGPSGDEVRAFCTDAKPGFFSDELNSYKHERCSIGHWTADAGQSSCANCPAGQHGLLLSEMEADGCGVFPDSYTAPCTVDLACESCDMGRFQPAEAQPECDACTTGKIGILAGQADEALACECCQSGHYSNVPASLECLRAEPAHHVSNVCQDNQSRCQLGLYQNLPAQAECKTCIPGHQASTSQTTCDMCGVGFESQLGTQCTPCTNGTFSDQPGVARCDASPPGHYVPPPMIETSLSDVSFAVTFFGGVAQQEGLDALLDTFLARLSSNADYLNGKEPTGCGENVASHKVYICVTSLTATEREALQAALPSMVMTGAGRRRTQDTHVDAVSQVLSASRREIRVRWESVQHRFLNDPAITHSNLDAIDTVTEVLQNAGYTLTVPLVVGDIHLYDETEGVTIEATFGVDIPDATFTSALESTIGATHQVGCPVGTVQPRSGQDACFPCDPGTIPNEHQTACDPCPLGHFGPDGISCNECLIGHFANTTGMAECLPAHPGSFVDSMGATFPTRCQALWYQDDYGQDECKMCTIGMEASLDATYCDPCAPGTYEQLPEGYWEEGSACVAGTTPTCRSLQCQPCEPGTFEPGRGSTRCQPARAGHFVSEPGAVNHTLCDVTLYQDEEGQTECKQCDRGNEPNGGWLRTSCVECDPGRASKDGLHCDLCPSGRFEADAASFECGQADLGHFVDIEGQTRQFPCPDGSVGLSYGMEICEPCQPGYESTNNHTACTACATGRAGVKVCISEEDLDEFGRCPQEDAPGGYETVHGATATQFCEECRPGKYGKYRGSVSCTLASVGHYVAGVGAIDENECQAGTVATEMGMISCETCVVGTAPSNDKAACVSCDAGRYGPNGTSVCIHLYFFLHGSADHLAALLSILFTEQLQLRGRHPA
eukprot:COSAG02_NODE_2585_length_8476_cov_18.560821_4_plen_1936_part_00